MRRILIAVVIAAVAAVWWYEQAETRALESRLRQLRSSTAERDVASAEQRQLKAALASKPKRSELIAVRADLERLRQPSPARPSLATTPIGEWFPANRWRNCGMSAPRDTLETALWAAAGGDIHRFSQLIEVSDDVRGKANELIAQLPVQSRAQYPSVESLLAAFAIKRIPIGSAQVVWAQQSDPDNATLCVFIRDPAVPQPSANVIPAHLQADDKPPPGHGLDGTIAIENADLVPPMIQSTDHTIAAFLSLHRDTDGWRLVVPSNAIDKIAKEISGTARR
jgi:hypothetical protein